jgi:predicted permease
VPDYFDRITAVPALDEQALFRVEGATFGDRNGAERLKSLRATPSFYRMIGVQPIAGRLFTDAEGEPGKEMEAVLAYAFWQRKFGGDKAAVGKTIRLNGDTYDIIGILPQDFSFLQNDIDVVLPAAFTPDQKSDQNRHSNNWQMVGHLKAAAALDQVTQQVDALNASNDVKFPEFHKILSDAHFHTVAVFLDDDVVRDVKKVLYLLWGGVLFVLVIGCVNIANLVMVRASGRTREMATRHAIGGDLSRLARQLLTETTILALTGGAFGILLGWWALRSLSALNLDKLPRGYEIGLDPITVVGIVSLTIVVGLLLGLAPVLRLWRMNLNLELREETRGGTSGRRANLVRNALATAQIALALMLLVGAGLLLASFRAVMTLDYGFTPDNVVTANLSLPTTSYKDAIALNAFQGRLLPAIRQLPGVVAAGGTTAIPFSGNINNNLILAEGYVPKPGESLLAPMQVTASPGYFDAMHIQMAMGRTFEDRDTREAPGVAIVDERLASKFWPGQEAIGRRLYQPSDPKDLTKITKDTRYWTVVGVAKDVQMVDPRADFVSVGTFYFAFPQLPPRGFTLTVRTQAPSASIQSDIRRVVASVDPQLPVFKAQPMQQWIDDALVGRRVPMLIGLAFGVVAMLLAAIGIYGVLAYSVAQRERELGVRMALGGSAASVFSLVLRAGLKIVASGLAIGLAGSIAVGQLMRSQLFNVTPLNPIVIALVTIALSIVALIASGLPAIRASRINPIVVLGK